MSRLDSKKPFFKAANTRGHFFFKCARTIIFALGIAEATQITGNIILSAIEDFESSEDNNTQETEPVTCIYGYETSAQNNRPDCMVNI